MKFEIKNRDAAGRLGRFTTDHGVVTTPNLMPVINPNRMLIPPSDMKKMFGAEIVITNSYIIRKHESLRTHALEKGVHDLIGFDGPIMTDSGTFQSYVYGDVEVEPVEIVEFQRDIGSDVGTILDIFGTPDQSFSEVEAGMLETVRRARASVEVKGDMGLACTIQGTVFPKLRKCCAEEMSGIGADFFPIGGVVPLMEQQRYGDLLRSILWAKRGLDPSKPVHLFGAGHPLVFPIAAALGCDFFDSSAYAKYASDGRMMFPWGTMHLDNMTELPCMCPVCSSHSVGELRGLDVGERLRLLAMHNLYVSFAEIRHIRQAIVEGTLWELAEERARCNPFLLSAMRELRRDEHKVFLERFEPVSTNRALTYTGGQTIHRPSIYRVHRRLIDRYTGHRGSVVVLPETTKPYGVRYSDAVKGLSDDIDVVVESVMGPVPLELDEMYPFAQSVFPSVVESETDTRSRTIFHEFIKDEDSVVFWDGHGDEMMRPGGSIDWDVRRVIAVADMQFGRGTSDVLFDGDISLVKSRNTGKIRNVLCDGVHVVSMRATDGLFTLKIEGGRRLIKGISAPALRVVVDDDAVPFVRDGKSVFSRFVVECDPDLRPWDECLLVSSADELLGVGRCLLNREEMLAFDAGMAAKTRESIGIQERSKE